jgi:hypothetical protein
MNSDGQEKMMCVWLGSASIVSSWPTKFCVKCECTFVEIRRANR